MTLQDSIPKTGIISTGKLVEKVKAMVNDFQTKWQKRALADQHRDIWVDAREEISDWVTSATPPRPEMTYMPS